MFMFHAYGVVFLNKTSYLSRKKNGSDCWNTFGWNKNKEAFRSNIFNVSGMIKSMGAINVANVTAFLENHHFLKSCHFMHYGKLISGRFITINFRNMCTFTFQFLALLLNFCLIKQWLSNKLNWVYNTWFRLYYVHIYCHLYFFFSTKFWCLNIIVSHVRSFPINITG